MIHFSMIKNIVIVLITTLYYIKYVKCDNNGTCWYNGKQYNFQYNLPSNKKIYGTPFSCNLIKYLNSFGYLDEKNFVDVSKTPIKGVKVVTAITQDHLSELRPLLKSFNKHFPSEVMIVYDLGLRKRAIRKLRQLKFVEYRKFDFSRYPQHVSTVKTYGFKFLVVSEVLRDYPSVMWADACVRFVKSNFIERINKLVNCYKGKNETHKYNEQLIIEKTKKRMNFSSYTIKRCPNCIPKYQKVGYDKKLYKFNVEHCYKSNVLMHIPTFHGILSSTHEKTLTYIPTDKSKYTPEKELQHGTGLVLFVRTKDTVENIMKWAVLCSLTEECIAPIPWFSCKGYFNNTNTFSKTHVCHRFDQTLLTILLHNSNNYNNQNYITEMYDYAIFKGDKIKTWKEFNLKKMKAYL